MIADIFIDFWEIEDVLKKQPAKETSWSDILDTSTKLPNNRLVTYDWQEDIPTKAIIITNNTSSRKVDFKILKNGEQMIFISYTPNVPNLILPPKAYIARTSAFYCDLDA